jgi:hypothetical protein
MVQPVRYLFWLSLPLPSDEEWINHKMKLDPAQLPMLATPSSSGYTQNQPFQVKSNCSG